MPNIKSNVPTPSVSISSIISKIDTITVEVGPTVRDYLTGEAADYFTDLRRALQIVSKYQGTPGEYNIVSAGDDLVVIQAIHASIGEFVGYLQGMASRTESTRKTTKSQYVMKIKEQRDKDIAAGAIGKITETETEDAARVLAIDAYDNARDMEVVSRMMSCGWYAIGDFCKVLNSVCNRASREQQT